MVSESKTDMINPINPTIIIAKAIGFLTDSLIGVDFLGLYKKGMQIIGNANSIKKQYLSRRTILSLDFAFRYYFASSLIGVKATETILKRATKNSY